MIKFILLWQKVVIILKSEGKKTMVQNSMVPVFIGNYLLAANRLTIIFGGIFGGLFVAFLVLVAIRTARKRTGTNEGKVIESQIEPTTDLKLMQKKMLAAEREQNYLAGVIYAFYCFRIFCQERLFIRNALSCPPEKIIKFIAGTPNLSLNKVKQLIVIYRKALTESKEIAREDYFQAKKLLAIIIGKKK
jgi:hypothetical protein